MFGTAQEFLVQVFNFKIVLAKNIVSDIPKTSLKNYLTLRSSHWSRQHHTKNAKKHSNSLFQALSDRISG